MTAVETVERGQMVERPAMKPGDTVRVHVKVREGEKERIQVFEGVVIGPRVAVSGEVYGAEGLVRQGSSASFRCTRRSSTASR